MHRYCLAAALLQLDLLAPAVSATSAASLEE